MIKEKFEFGKFTILSGRYLINRLEASKREVPEDYEELNVLFRKFERNIDKNKPRKLISTFIR